MLADINAVAGAKGWCGPLREGERVLGKECSRVASVGATLAEAYGWGKLLGLRVPWAIDATSRIAGLNAYAVERLLYRTSTPGAIR